jgi:glycosyltransferase involved in cell wall biosynthesis
MSQVPQKVAVDLTPVLPGGENGGAKIFVLDLLSQLAEMRPDTQFILLTQAASHDELAHLDRPNMQRRMVLGALTADSSRSRLKSLAGCIAPRVPARFQRVLSRVVYRLNAKLKRRGTEGLLRQLGVDLLFCPFTAPTYFDPSIPTVCTIYDLQYKTYPEFFTPEDVAQRAQTFVDAARRANALAAISDYSRQSAIDHGDLEPDRIRTIHLRMARRIAPDASQSTDVLDRLELTRQRYLVFPANFWKHKNHEMLLTAFGMACREGGLDPYIKLVCTGAPGPRRDWLMRAAHALNLGDRIIFPGYLPNAELAALISHSTGVVFPSLYEGFGLPVIEAMAAGVPVACSNTTSLPEVAADAAIMFDPRIPEQIAAAMIALVKDEPLRAKLVEAGRRRADEFSDSKRMANEYWDLFASALANSRHENLITGVHVDGWVGGSLKIQTAPLSGARSVEVTFLAPAWLPQRSVTVQRYRQGKPDGDAVKLKRGSETVVSLPMDGAGGFYELQFKPTFVPARHKLGDDQRELSAMLQRCSIVADDNAPIELFPEKVSA